MRTRSPAHLACARQVSLPTGTPSAGGTAPAGSLSAYTTRLIASKPFQDFRDIAKSINKLFPKEIQEARAALCPAAVYTPPTPPSRLRPCFFDPPPLLLTLAAPSSPPPLVVG